MDSLVLWTIYDHPRDFPRHVVVRAQVVVPRGTVMHAIACLCDTVEEAREVCMAQGTSGFFDRDPDDDPVIVETWI